MNSNQQKKNLPAAPAMTALQAAPLQSREPSHAHHEMWHTLHPYTTGLMETMQLDNTYVLEWTLLDN